MRSLLALPLTALLATNLLAKERPPAEGLNAMPAKDIARLNATFGAPSDRYDTPPRLLEAYIPIYPASRLQSGETGACKVAFTIDANGRPSDAEADPQADEKMCAHALHALPHWRFSPASKGGTPVEVRFRIPFNYDIR